MECIPTHLRVIRARYPKDHRDTLGTYESKGDHLVLRFTNSGTNVGPFMGNPAAGKRPEWLGIGIYTVCHSRITEGWFAEDILGLLLQLDAIALP